MKWQKRDTQRGPTFIGRKKTCEFQIRIQAIKASPPEKKGERR